MSKVFTRTQFNKSREEALERARVRGDEQLQLIEEKLVPLFEKNSDFIIEAINKALESFIEPGRILSRDDDGPKAYCNGGYYVHLRICVSGDVGIMSSERVVKKMIFDKALKPILTPFTRSDDDDGWLISYGGDDIVSNINSTDMIYLTSGLWSIAIASQQTIEMVIRFH